MKWTDYDMADFANFCGRQGDIGFLRTTGKWHIDDATELTTEELLEFYKKQLIPQFPSTDDLKGVKLGPEQY